MGPSEPRVAASPDTVKRFTALGVDIAVDPGAGTVEEKPRFYKISTIRLTIEIYGSMMEVQFSEISNLSA
jgi:hypothetical protein